LGINWIIIEDNAIRNNAVHASDTEAYGGGIYVGTNARIANNVIESNTNQCAGGIARGAGISCESVLSPDSVSFYNNIVRNNEANGNYVLGGGINIYYLKIHFAGNQVLNNAANGSTNWNGGGIWIRQILGTCNIINNTISGNTGNDTGGSKGGGIFIVYSDFNEALINRNIISNNSATYGGGISTFDAFNIYITNNLFTYNSAEYGGALDVYHYTSRGDEMEKTNLTEITMMGQGSYIKSLDSARTIIINNTFSKNNAVIQGGAVQTREYPGNVLLMNSILWDNNAPSGKDIYKHAATQSLIIDHCDLDPDNIVGSWSGNGNINEDPEFINPDDNDFHIPCSSLCWNAGADSVTVADKWYYCPIDDLDGNQRPDTIYFKPDMGAFENQDDINPGLPRNRENIVFGHILIHPNPFSSSTIIEYELNYPAKVTITFYNQFGEQVDVIEQSHSAGKQHVVWNPEDLSPGICYLRLQAGNQTAQGKVVLMR
jgi:hypothetical protein